MRALTGTVNTVYPELIQAILTEGSEVPSRNGPTKELHPCVLQIEDPRKRLVTSYERPVNVAFALAEVLWILAGRRDVEMLKFYNKRIDTWSDDGATFNAPYGYRLREAHGVDQLEDVIRTLQADPGSRQATLCVWHPPSDKGWDLITETYTKPGVGIFAVESWEPHRTADRACNMLSHLMIREGALDWMHIVRSNDAIWGVPYNFMQWMHLQEYVADQVGVPVGKFFHMVDSMHIYGDMTPQAGSASTDTARWDEAERIRPFDLYKHTGLEHARMGALPASELSEILAVESIIRQVPSVNHRDITGHINKLSVSGYWKNVLDILHAHSLYLEGNNRSAFEALQGNPDRVLALAQVRFYTSMRWGKDQSMVAKLIDTYNSDEQLIHWLLGSHAR